MIRFDNGPPDGDYVRYIDALMASRAAALTAPTAPTMAADTGSDDREMRYRVGAPTEGTSVTGAPRFKAPHERSPTSRPTSPGAANPFASTMPSSSGDAHQPQPPLSPAAAAAIASAMMTGETERRAVPLASVVAIVIGGALIAIGVAAETFNALFIIAGAALVSWALKRLTRLAAPPVAPTTDAFAATPAERAAARLQAQRKR